MMMLIYYTDAPFLSAECRGGGVDEGDVLRQFKMVACNLCLLGCI